MNTPTWMVVVSVSRFVSGGDSVPHGCQAVCSVAAQYPVTTDSLPLRYTR